MSKDSLSLINQVKELLESTKQSLRLFNSKLAVLYHKVRSSDVVKKIGSLARFAYNNTIKATLRGGFNGLGPYYRFANAPLVNYKELQALYKDEKNVCFFIGTLFSIPLAVPTSIIVKTLTGVPKGLWNGMKLSLKDYYTDTKTFFPWFKKLKTASIPEGLAMLPGAVVGTALGQAAYILIALPRGMVVGGASAYNFSRAPRLFDIFIQPADKLILKSLGLFSYTAGAALGGTIMLVTKPLHSKENFENTVAGALLPFAAGAYGVKKVIGKFSSTDVAPTSALIEPPAAVVPTITITPPSVATMSSMSVIPTPSVMGGMGVSVAANTSSFELVDLDRTEKDSHAKMVLSR